MHTERFRPSQRTIRGRSIQRVIRSVMSSATALAALVACQPKTDAAKAESAFVVTNPPAPHADPPIWVLNEFGYGPIVVGMPYAAANDSLKGNLKAAKGANLAECDYVTWEGGPVGLGIMVIEGKIARVDVRDTAGIPTDLGAKVGDSEERIKTLYGTRVKVTNHKYEDGHYLTVRSATPTDTLHFIIFETSKGVVTRMRAGAMPGVAYVEGCS